MPTLHKNASTLSAASDRLLVTIAVGSDPLWEQSHPLMKEYAKKVGADFAVLRDTDRQCRDPKLLKLTIHSLLDRYSRILFVDGDVGINPRYPDLFRIVPEEELGAVCEKAPYYNRAEAMRKACEYYGVKYSPGHGFFNTGMMVISRRQKDMFAGDNRERMKRIGGFFDQAYFNAMALKHNIRIRDLGVRFNYFGSLVHNTNRPFPPDEAHVFHATGGCGDRLGHMKRTVAKWREDAQVGDVSVEHRGEQAGANSEGTLNAADERTVWIGGFDTCSCTNRCGHVGMRSYVACYQTVLDLVRPKLVYEWGPGENSRMAVRAGAQVVAVEQDPRFVPTDLRDGFRAFVVEVDDPSYPIPRVKNADIYFIDSRRRAECISAVWRECVRKAYASDTVVALHDAQRRRYHDALRLFPYVKFLYY